MNSITFICDVQKCIRIELFDSWSNNCRLYFLDCIAIKTNFKQKQLIDSLTFCYTHWLL
jgi:hypothetical protein